VPVCGAAKFRGARAVHAASPPCREKAVERTAGVAEHARLFTRRTKRLTTRPATGHTSATENGPAGIMYPMPGRTLAGPRQPPADASKKHRGRTRAAMLIAMLGPARSFRAARARAAPPPALKLRAVSAQHCGRKPPPAGHRRGRAGHRGGPAVLHLPGMDMHATCLGPGRIRALQATATRRARTPPGAARGARLRVPCKWTARAAPLYTAGAPWREAGFEPPCRRGPPPTRAPAGARLRWAHQAAVLLPAPYGPQRHSQYLAL